MVIVMDDMTGCMVIVKDGPRQQPACLCPNAESATSPLMQGLGLV